MADLTIRFLGDTSKLRRSTGEAEGLVGRFSGKVASVGRIAAGVFAGSALLGGIQKLTGGFSGLIGEAREAEKMARMTNAVIKSTGGVAKVTAKQVDTLATSIANKAGMDDEAVQSAENLLLTFTGIRNEVGKGNDIFNQATQAVTDISAALGEDMSSASIQVGKALNDPIKGVTALQRVGVSFTQKQKDQIKALVETGDKLGAQKLILHELGVEFGGAAAAAADPLARLDATLKNLRESIGERLLPYLNFLATFLADNLPGAIDTVIAFIGKFVDKVRSDLPAAIKQGRAELQPFFDMFQRNRDTIIIAAAAIATFAGSFAAMRQAQAGISALQTLGPVLGAIVSTLGSAGVLIALAVAAVAAVGVAFYLAYTKIEPFRNAVDKVVGKIVDVAKAIYKWIMGTAVPAITGFAGAVKDAVSTAIDWFGQVFGAVTTALAPIASWINDNFISTFNAVAEFVAAWAARVGEMFSNMAKLVEMGFGLLKAIVMPIMTVLSSFIGSTLQMIVKSFQALMNFLRPLWSLFWASLKAVVSIVFGGIRAIIEQVLGIIRGIFQVFTGLLRGDWSKVWEGLKTIVSSAWEPIRKFLSGALDTLVGYFKGLPGRLKDLGKGLFDFIKEAFKSAINWVIRGWNNLDFDLNIPSNPVTDFFGIGGKGFTIGTPDIPELARGGIISRPTLALVGERGPEAVIPLNRGRGVGGRSEFHITVYAQDGRDFGRQFLDYVKSNGGREVKQALGISA